MNIKKFRILFFFNKKYSYLSTIKLKEFHLNHWEKYNNKLKIMENIPNGKKRQNTYLDGGSDFDVNKKTRLVLLNERGVSGRIPTTANIGEINNKDNVLKTFDVCNSFNSAFENDKSEELETHHDKIVGLKIPTIHDTIKTEKKVIIKKECEIKDVNPNDKIGGSLENDKIEGGLENEKIGGGLENDKKNELPEQVRKNVNVIVTWNMNSITVRYKNKEKWKRFMKFVNEINADVLCFQEVRLPALNISKNESKNVNNKVYGGKKNEGEERNRGSVKNTDQKSLIDYKIVEEILKNDFKEYNGYFSLANIKYSGQLVLVKKSIKVKSVRYNLLFETDPNIHNDEGRIILLEFSNFYLLSTYSPNNGFDQTKFKRRSLFDNQMKEFVLFMKNENKNLIWTGDLNIAPEDVDLSHPIEFRKMKKGNVPKEYIGQPGCTDAERANFKTILKNGDLIDSYRYFENYKIKNDPTYKRKTNINDNIYTWRCPFLIGKSCNRAMRIDHFIVSKNLLNQIENIEIHGYSVFHTNFYGSDHCPVILNMKK
ncbi:AP endonuclease (DNA-[apurinic or apyrimidinic site] lyase), putative [Plasmodium berghei]|uniref:DNA-(apurinic or apyrimidinic site) endonuclease n=2 Tax=Plasmodium berghei TaxID=5821 RepID=APEX_PLABA|nr:DNA-(apurinic or apyrimidinic site) lyase, putative [Plasmodium berghei ANKA]A0A509ADV9.1 RecName: Full=DNA-(apurinic or apyrimidinic site) endonuclease; Flags: Precursor [Plasmodium berghei ANKA]CXH99956.1 AP endonuclease (DNA-[apurinic or apyrimidinic site] lyase), putative [Plasmodium berghei]SCL91623.1 AP endonuclease (DNA-[apurinic or apyrimidinic site] lyase), putative [Plasmodium berghei]SCM15500.1 AP endonuclease (DNA-[apurinic or apyrimidinic site] lyase), putative [Plasmodium bergh|eukprot:XP_034420098.1 DNA-(apurinic or apyrimidinic site) lyase, putative [Plasmodium berghei ANKA]